MPARPSRRLALEVANSAVRLAEVSSGGGRPRLVNVTQVRLPARAVVDGVVNDAHAVTEAIKRCVKDGDFSAKEVHVGVAGLRAITREIEMPAVPDSELDDAARLQVLDVIPFPADKTLLSARSLGEVAEHSEGPPIQRVLLAAAHRDVVEPLLAAVEKAGLVPVSVELSALGLLRCLASETGPDESEAIVSIGAGLTVIVVHEEGVPHFVRSVALGGDGVTAAITSALDVPPGDGEAMKRHLDQPGPHLRAAAAAAHGVIVQLAGEIQSSLEYYATLPGRKPVARVQLTGGGSLLFGLSERLSQQLSAEVSSGSALARFDLGSLRLDDDEQRARDPFVATVAGLALPDSPGAKPLDLLPPEIIAARRHRRVERNLIGVAAAIVLALVGLGALRFTKVRQAETQVSGLEHNAQAMKAAIARQEGHAKAYDAITSDEAAVSPVLNNEVNWPVVFSDLAKDTPPGGVVTSVTGTYTAPATPASSAPSSSSSTTTTVPAGSSSTAARETVTIATLNVGLSTNQGYAYFSRWLKAMSTSKHFRYVTFSGLSAKGPTVTWTAQLAVLGTIRSSRISKFEVTAR